MRTALSDPSADEGRRALEPYQPSEECDSLTRRELRAIPVKSRSSLTKTIRYSRHTSQFNPDLF